MFFIRLFLPFFLNYMVKYLPSYSIRFLLFFLMPFSGEIPIFVVILSLNVTCYCSFYEQHFFTNYTYNFMECHRNGTFHRYFWLSCNGSDTTSCYVKPHLSHIFIFQPLCCGKIFFFFVHGNQLKIFEVPINAKYKTFKSVFVLGFAFMFLKTLCHIPSIEQFSL